MNTTYRSPSLDPRYVAYFYEAGLVQRYLDSTNRPLREPGGRATSTYDFSSDLLGPTRVYPLPSVEQIIARGYLALDGIDVICIPSFTEVDIDNQERTALRFLVEPR